PTLHASTCCFGRGFFKFHLVCCSLRTQPSISMAYGQEPQISFWSGICALQMIVKPDISKTNSALLHRESDENSLNVSTLILHLWPRHASYFALRDHSPDFALIQVLVDVRVQVLPPLKEH